MKELITTRSESHAFGICLELADQNRYAEIHEINKHGNKVYRIMVETDEEQSGCYPGLRSVI